MNKIICDVCGTMYPESAAQCPICGCAKQAEVETPTADMIPEETETGSYTPVKGGRFSKANVRKRNKNVEQPVVEEVTVGEAEEAPIAAPVKEKNDDKGDNGVNECIDKNACDCAGNRERNESHKRLAVNLEFFCFHRVAGFFKLFCH